MHREQTRISARTPLYGISFPDTLAPSTATAGADNASRAFRMPGRTIPRKVRHAAVLCTALLVGAVLLLGQAAPSAAKVRSAAATPPATPRLPPRWRAAAR